MQNRRAFIKKCALGLSAVGFSPLLTACDNESVKITILHTNDVHSRIDPFPSSHSRWPGQGGFARRAWLVDQIRSEQEHVLLLDCGDIFQGTPYFNIYKGRLEIELMNKMAYDAATLGNHEFDNGIEALAEQFKHANFPFVCSNYDLSQTVLHNQTLPYKIIEKGSVKIGIIGLGIELNGLVNPQYFKEAKVLDPIKMANQTADLLKQDKACDMVIALSHLGYKYKNDRVSDVEVARNSSEIDMILGGHTHTFLDKPDVIKNKEGKNVIVNQVGWAGVYLGRIDIELSKNYQGEVTILNSTKHV